MKRITRPKTLQRSAIDLRLVVGVGHDFEERDESFLGINTFHREVIRVSARRRCTSSEVAAGAGSPPAHEMSAIIFISDICSGIGLSSNYTHRPKKREFVQLFRQKNNIFIKFIKSTF